MKRHISHSATTTNIVSSRKEATSLNTPLRIKDLRELTAEALLTEEEKLCVTCKSTVKKEESTYLMWQRMCFCDLICLHWYLKQHLTETCSSCFIKIPPECYGNLVFRFDQLLQFCTIPCFLQYQAKRKSCLYCMAKIINFVCRVNLPNPAYCSQECAFKHRKGTDLNFTDSGQICFVCGSHVKPITIHLQAGKEVKMICNQFCLHYYSALVRVALQQCSICKMYFSSEIFCIRTVHKGSNYLLCSKKCETRMIFSTIQVYPCAICHIARFDIDLIRRYSKIEPTDYTCSITCYLRKYSAAHSSTTQLLPNIGALTSNERSTSTDDVGRLIATNDVIHTNSLNETMLSTETINYYIFKSNHRPEQQNVATMCSVQTSDKSSCAKPDTIEQSSQTDFPEKTEIIPIHIPIYVPAPMHMFSVPLPTPVPFPLPIPVPIFIPITKKNAKKIFNDIEDILYRSPNTLPEADVLAIAEMVEEGARKQLETDLDLSKSAVDEMFSDDMLDSTFEDNKSSPNYISNQFDEKNSLDVRLGVQAWQQWIKQSKIVVFPDPNHVEIHTLPPFQLADCMSVFVREVKRPNGKSYAPDTVLYLCLCIQKHLLANGHVSNMFFDDLFKEFNINLDRHMKLFPLLFLDSLYIVTRVEEEHLWECGLLGIHSPYVLLNTVLYNNMKYCHLMTVKENMSLFRYSFVKTVKDNKNQDENSETVLRFYSDKEQKHFCDMAPNSSNRERCPIKHFDFYISKLPTVDDENLGQFYFRPQPSNTVDDSVWYSTESLDMDHLEIMINRLKVVKELNMLEDLPE